MNAVVFGYDPPYEIVLVSAILCMLAVIVLVSKKICSNPMLTDGFAKEFGHQDVQVYTRDREEEKEEQVIVDCDSRSDASLVSRHMTSDGQGRKIFL